MGSQAILTGSKAIRFVIIYDNGEDMANKRAQLDKTE